jgi:hypothetical protein
MTLYQNQHLPFLFSPEILDAINVYMFFKSNSLSSVQDNYNNLVKNLPDPFVQCAIEIYYNLKNINVEHFTGIVSNIDKCINPNGVTNYIGLKGGTYLIYLVISEYKDISVEIRDTELMELIYDLYGLITSSYELFSGMREA